MKRIEAILRPEGVEAVLDALKQAGCPGVMVTEIEGHGKQKGISQNWRGQEYKVDLLPKVRVEVVVADKDAAGIVKTIASTAQTGKIGDGKIFISEVLDAIRIRTGEKGDAALS